MGKNKKGRANGSSVNEKKAAKIANSSLKRQKSDEEEEFEYAPLIFHRLSSAKAKEQNQKNMTTAKNSETESKQNKPRDESTKYTDESKRNNATNENDKKDEELNAEIIDRIVEIDIKTLDFI
jgi:hypothetical protein